MSMLKIIEVLAESEKSWEDAARTAVANAGETLRGIKSINIENFQATVADGKIKTFRVNAKISFMLDR
ncbi:MAG: dodecin family protein [Cucumibacter sp.]